MTLLRICWVVDGIALLIALYFFLDGLLTVTLPDPAFFGAWFFMLGLLILGIWGSYRLLRQGHLIWATLLAAVPALPATLFGLWVLTALLGPGHWH